MGVTGATGFVGRHVVQALRDRGHFTITLGRTPCSTEHRQLDLQTTFASDVVDGLDALVHCAAYLPASYSDSAAALRCFQVNAVSTLALLEACAQRGVQQVVHLSTNLYRFTQTPVREQAAFEPSSHAACYLVSKAAADFFATSFAERARVAVFRLGSVFGPGLERGIIATFTSKLLANEEITVDDGGYQADFVDVRDVSAAVTSAITRGASGPFNIGSGVASRPLEVARILMGEIGAAPALMRVVPGDPRPRGFAALDSTRAREELGLAPRTLASGLRDLVAGARR